MLQQRVKAGRAHSNVKILFTLSWQHCYYTDDNESSNRCIYPNLEEIEFDKKNVKQSENPYFPLELLALFGN
jgi:hypothetical protein